MRIVRFVKNKVSTLINEAKEDAVKSLGCLFPIFVGTILFITFAVAYIMFIAADGYGVQIANIKNNGIAGIGESFTTGTVGNVYMKVLFIALQIMLACEFIICIINYFVKESIIKKIIVVIDLIVLFLFGGIFLVFDAVNHRRIILSKEQEDYIIAMMGEDGADRYMK